MWDGAVETAQVRDCLKRIVGSAAFHGSPNLVAFLVYVTEAVLSGESGSIKAYTVATHALGRAQDFDPQNDPIVRTEARRLRRALAVYYAGAGAGDPVRLVLPVGQYVPQFLLRDDRSPLLSGESAREAAARESVPASAYLTFLATFFLNDGARPVQGRVSSASRLDLAA